jgi:hypothetical protein
MYGISTPMPWVIWFVMLNAPIAHAQMHASYSVPVMPFDRSAWEAASQEDARATPDAMADVRQKANIYPYHLMNIVYDDLSTRQQRSRIVFPIKVSKAPDRDGDYFSQTVYFDGGDFAYIGIRPRQGGKNLAAFSVFGSGAEIVTPATCTSGADGGAGISCSRLFSLEKGRTYYFTIRRDSHLDRRNKQAWSGYMSGNRGQEGQRIGSWLVPHYFGMLKRVIGFVEHYQPVSSCQHLAPVDVTFGAPYMANGQKLGIKYHYRPDTVGSGIACGCNGAISPRQLAKISVTMKAGEVRVRTGLK